MGLVRARWKLPAGLALWEWLSLRCGDQLTTAAQSLKFHLVSVSKEITIQITDFADLCSAGPMDVVVYLFVVLCGSKEKATRTLFDIYCLIVNIVYSLVSRGAP